jgi:hypothetical protein
MIVIGWDSREEYLADIGWTLCVRCSNRSAHGLSRSIRTARLMFIPVYRGRSSHGAVCSVCGHCENLTDREARLWLMRTGSDDDGRVMLSPHLGSAEQRVEIAFAWRQVVGEMQGENSVGLSRVTTSHDRRGAATRGNIIASGLAQHLSISQGEADAIVFEDRFDPSFYIDDDGQPLRDIATSNRKIEAAKREARVIY